MRNIRVVSISKQMVNFCFKQAMNQPPLLFVADGIVGQRFLQKRSPSIENPRLLPNLYFKGHVTFNEETRVGENL